MKAAIIGIVIMLCLHAIDVIAGLISAIKNKNVSSGTLRNGLFKKIGFIFCYIVAFIIDYYGSFINLELGVNVLPLVLLYAAFTEITSILENISEINENLALSKLMTIFKITTDESEDNKDE